MIALRAARAAGILILLAGLSGCGYTQSGDANAPAVGGYQWHSLYREDVKSVAVPIFVNRTFYRGVEFALSKAVINQMEQRTPYKIEPRERADTILEEDVQGVHFRTVSHGQSNALPQEQLYVVIVNFTWKDLRTGKILAQRRDFEQTAPYYPTLGEGQFVGQQENVERLALAIVDEMQ